jgi:hypothetical protein
MVGLDYNRVIRGGRGSGAAKALIDGNDSWLNATQLVRPFPVHA